MGEYAIIFLSVLCLLGLFIVMGILGYFVAVNISKRKWLEVIGLVAFIVVVAILSLLMISSIIEMP